MAVRTPPFLCSLPPLPTTHPTVASVRCWTGVRSRFPARFVIITRTSPFHPLYYIQFVLYIFLNLCVCVFLCFLFNLFTLLIYNAVVQTRPNAFPGTMIMGKEPAWESHSEHEEIEKSRSMCGCHLEATPHDILRRQDGPTIQKHRREWQRSSNFSVYETRVYDTKIAKKI